MLAVRFWTLPQTVSATKGLYRIAAELRRGAARSPVQPERSTLTWIRCISTYAITGEEAWSLAGVTSAASKLQSRACRLAFKFQLWIP